MSAAASSSFLLANAVETGRQMSAANVSARRRLFIEYLLEESILHSSAGESLRQNLSNLFSVRLRGLRPQLAGNVEDLRGRDAGATFLGHFRSQCFFFFLPPDPSSPQRRIWHL